MYKVDMICRTMLVAINHQQLATRLLLQIYYLILLTLDNVVNYELEKTEVRELQILRDYSDYLSIVCVYGNSIYSSCSDGHIYAHTFPELDKGTVHYDMAFDDEGKLIIFTLP